MFRPGAPDLIEFGLQLRDARELNRAGVFQFFEPFASLVEDAMNFGDLGSSRVIRRSA
jgi:hypothetical protein